MYKKLFSFNIPFMSMLSRLFYDYRACTADIFLFFLLNTLQESVGKNGSKKYKKNCNVSKMVDTFINAILSDYSHSIFLSLSHHFQDISTFQK